METQGEFRYWLSMTLLGSLGFYIFYLIGSALSGNGIDMRRFFSGMNAERDIYFFATDPVKFCSVIFLYIFFLGMIVYYIRQHARDRKFQIDMMKARKEK
jgi:hypothetical protein